MGFSSGGRTRNPKIDEAIRAFPLASWLSLYVRVKDSGGRNLYADCPVCAGKYKIMVRKDTRSWRCFKCSDSGQSHWRAHGSLIGLVQHLEGLSTSKAITFVAEKAGVEDIRLERPEAPPKLLPDNIFPLTDADESHLSRRQLRKRGLDHLTEKIFVDVSGEYKGRWILPCNFMGRLVAFEAKTYYEAVTPKALYPEWFATQDYVYTTYGWDTTCPAAIVTESIFDAETFGQNAVGIYGSHLYPGQFDALLELKKQRGVEVLYWALDPDAWRRQSQMILQRTAGVFRNFILNYPVIEGRKLDPNELGHECAVGLLETATEVHSELDILLVDLQRMAS